MRAKAATALLLILLLVGTVPLAVAEEEKRYAFRTTYVFENRGNSTYVLTEDDASIVIFVDDDWQTVTTRNASHRVVRQYEDVDGNPIAVMDLPPELPPSSSVLFSMEYVIKSTDRMMPEIVPEIAGTPSDIPQRLVDEFCLETETYRMDDEIEYLARRITAGETTVLGIMTRLVGWILENVTYGNFEVPRYPHETIGDRRGDCDDQAILLITMLRSLGVPSLLQIGVVFSDGIDSERTSWDDHLTIVQKGIGWHGWAMVYVPPWGWLPVDLTLTGSEDPMDAITKAPEYASYVVTAYNVSRQTYVGDSRASRERTTSSSVYITLTDLALAERASTDWLRIIYIFTGMLAGGAFVAFIIVMNRRRRILGYSL